MYFNGLPRETFFRRLAPSRFFFHSYPSSSESFAGRCRRPASHAVVQHSFAGTCICADKPLKERLRLLCRMFRPCFLWETKHAARVSRSCILLIYAFAVEMIDRARLALTAFCFVRPAARHLRFVIRQFFVKYENVLMCPERHPLRVQKPAGFRLFPDKLVAEFHRPEAGRYELCGKRLLRRKADDAVILEADVPGPPERS